MIELLDICKNYTKKAREVEVLKDISFTVKSGDYIAIMGPSGSGKSTLMNIIGFLDRPTSGRYVFCGREISSISQNALAALRNEYIGFIFQSFFLIEKLNAIENIEMPMRFAGVPEMERKKRAENLIDELGMRERARHMPSELSGGQRQRIAIARALANRPSLILADEPTGNLDEKTGRDVLAIFDELNRHGTAIIMNTHDAEVAKKARITKHLLNGRLEDAD